MADDKTLEILVRVVDEASASMKKIEEQLSLMNKRVEESGKKQSTGWDLVKENILGVIGAYTALMYAIEKTWQTVEAGARATRTEAAFKSLAESAGESSEAIVSAMKKATAETVDDSDLMATAMRRMTSGMSGKDVAKLMEAARVVSRAQGTDLMQTFETMAFAIENRVPRALRRLGLVTKEQMAVMQEAVSAGVANYNMMELVLTNVEKVSTRIGPIVEDSIDKMNRFRAELHQVKELVGKELLSAFANMWDRISYGAEKTGINIASALNKKDIYDGRQEDRRTRGIFGGRGPEEHRRRRAEKRNDDVGATAATWSGPRDRTANAAGS